jgi:hypothetical protein
MNIGDVVYLKSGSPPLAVRHLWMEGNQATVTWMVDDNVQEMTLPVVCFQAEKPSDDWKRPVAA